MDHLRTNSSARRPVSAGEAALLLLAAFNFLAGMGVGYLAGQGPSSGLQSAFEASLQQPAQTAKTAIPVPQP